MKSLLGQYSGEKCRLAHKFDIQNNTKAFYPLYFMILDCTTSFAILLLLVILRHRTSGKATILNTFTVSFINIYLHLFVYC